MYTPQFVKNFQYQCLHYWTAQIKQLNHDFYHRINVTLNNDLESNFLLQTQQFRSIISIPLDPSFTLPIHLMSCPSQQTTFVPMNPTLNYHVYIMSRLSNHPSSVTQLGASFKVGHEVRNHRYSLLTENNWTYWSIKSIYMNSGTQ
jgi:hypothetical protein